MNIWRYVPTDYYVLMPLTPSTNNAQTEGRSGFLLQKDKDSNYFPVTVKINGKEFLIKIKGVGSLDGNNKYPFPIARTCFNGGLDYSLYGSIKFIDAYNEFYNLISQKTRPRFQQGLTPRPILLSMYNDPRSQNLKRQKIGDQGYLISLTPSELRLSNEGPFPEKNLESILKSLADDFSELLKSGFIHLSMHPENVILFQEKLENGLDLASLTDYADTKKLKDFNLTRGNIINLFNSIFEIKGVFKEEAKSFLIRVGENLGVKLNGKSFNKMVLDLWYEYFKNLN